METRGGVLCCLGCSRGEYLSPEIIHILLLIIRASLVAQRVKNLPAMRETWVRSLGWEDPLEEGMGPTPVFLPGESLWTEEPGRL